MAPLRPLANRHLYPGSTPTTNTLHASIPSRHSLLDEGYDEDRSQSDGDMLDVSPLDHTLQHLLASALDLPTEQRKQLIELLIRSVPNAVKETLGLLCDELIHFDPVHYLPNELMLHVFSYLDPADLLAASVVSRPWRERSRDERLWRICFAREGWVVDKGRLAAFEAREKSANQDEAAHARPSDAVAKLSRSGSRKRPREEAFSESEPRSGPHASLSDDDDDDDDYYNDDSSMGGMEVASTAETPIATSSGLIRKDYTPRRASNSDGATISTSCVSHPMYLQISPTLWTGTSLDPKLSWPYLYKQRYRLEKNWEVGRNTPFQLPHAGHLDEGHEECVYTIQHTSKYLVSGSRDKTIRRWDLGTNRLVGVPLCGHVASVLCLQFDPRPEHDIIVSGGSDSYVIVWKFSTGEIVKKMTNAHTESVLNLRFDDRYLVTCSKDRTIKIWNRRALALDDPVLPAHVLPGAGKLLVGDFIKEYSLISTLEGHGAAVNAVMIHENTIVSASGDRTIKSWSIDTGKLIKTYTGHTKGIACVQYDGRRIVSGSSDNTVRIFDAEKAAEIACLSGHSNLVRTVQARFGDLDTVTDEELAQQARDVDRSFYSARSNGMPIQRSARNAGSLRPEALTAVGTRIPPGGGGTRWAKIVSGSYDETVLVWKRDRDGNWVRRVVLSQDLLRRGRGNNRAPVGPGNAPPPQPAALTPAHHGTAQGAHAVQPPPPAQHQIANHPHATNATVQMPAAQVANAAPAPAGAPVAHHHHGPVQPNSNRVFKLQFDTRRVVACSQNRVIVGWDFACGDAELERVGDWSVETS